jgi:hypothetical protein
LSAANNVVSMAAEEVSLRCGWKTEGAPDSAARSSGPKPRSLGHAATDPVRRPAREHVMFLHTTDEVPKRFDGN